jgi:hypothetical protein
MQDMTVDPMAGLAELLAVLNMYPGITERVM